MRVGRIIGPDEPLVVGTVPVVAARHPVDQDVAPVLGTEALGNGERGLRDAPVALHPDDVAIPRDTDGGPGFVQGHVVAEFRGRLLQLGPGVFGQHPVTQCIGQQPRGVQVRDEGGELVRIGGPPLGCEQRPQPFQFRSHFQGGGVLPQPGGGPAAQELPGAGMGQQQVQVPLPDHQSHVVEPERGVFAAGQVFQIGAFLLRGPAAEVQFPPSRVLLEDHPGSRRQQRIEHLGFEFPQVVRQRDGGSPQAGQLPQQQAQFPGIIGVPLVLQHADVAFGPGGRVVFSGTQFVGDAGGLQHVDPHVGTHPVRGHAEQRLAHRLVPFRQLDQGLGVAVPENGGGVFDGGGTEQRGQQPGLHLQPVGPGGPDQAAHVRRETRVGRQAAADPVDVELEEQLKGVRGGVTFEEGLGFVGEFLGAQRPRQRELQKHLAVAFLIDGQTVHPLGLAGLVEELHGVAEVVVAQEDPRALLQEGGEEMRGGVPEPPCQLVEELLGRAGLAAGEFRGPVEITDQVQGVPGICRVRDDRPGRETYGAVADVPHPGGPVRGETQHAETQVLHLGEVLPDQAHHYAALELGMGVATRLQGHGVRDGVGGNTAQFCGSGICDHAGNLRVGN